MNNPLLDLIAEHDWKVNSGNAISSKRTHSIAQCQWDTTLDDPKIAHRLQEYLSHWSNSGLNSILEQAFEQYCPVGQIWRIPRLELDLGEIAFDDLQTELPKRLQTCLCEQLKKLLHDMHWQAENAESAWFENEWRNDSQIHSQSQSFNDFIGYFLRNGIAPWWYTDKLGHAEILRQQLQNAPQQIAAIIRDAGQSEAVRKRIAWQYPRELIKKIIEALEPQHHEYIVAFADNLQDLQARTQEPESDKRTFERQSWFWILTHLLVERGSLFNTMAFIESTLKQMAHSYQLDYHGLLQQMGTAAQSLKHKGGYPPQFIQALTDLQQKTLPQAVENAALITEIDYWQLFSNSLQGRQSPSIAGSIHSIGELFTLLVRENPAKIAAIIRDEGQSEAVRRRIAWQCPQDIIKKIIEALEPHHYDYIVAFADNLQDMQARTQEPKSDKDAFERQSWFWILTHLLVERGSLFNTMAFIESTLKQMAHSYQLNYHSLLQQLVIAAQNLEQKGGTTPQFIHALVGLQQNILPKTGEDLALTTEIDYWQLFINSLQGGQSPSNTGNIPSIGELFSLLASENPAKMADLLKAEGRDARVRQKLINQLSRAEWSQLVSVLMPQNHLFIVAYAHQCCQVLARHQSGQQHILEQIFSYLLKPIDGQFNQGQFVSGSLLTISKALSISYPMALDMLIQTNTPDLAYTHRLELLSILCESKQQYHARDGQEPQTDDIYCQALATYLSTGHAPKVIGKHYLPTVELMFSTLLYRHSQQLASLVAKIFKANPNTELKRQILSKRLLPLIQPADFPLMLAALDASAAPFAESLITMLLNWQRQQSLPSIRGFDAYYQLHGLVLDVLIDGIGTSFTVSGFLHRFFTKLAARHGIDSLALATEMALSLSSNSSAQDSTPNSEQHALLEWLNNGKASQINTLAEVDMDFEQASVMQKMTALLCYLRRDEAGLQALGLAQTDSKTALSRLFAGILPHHAAALLEELQQQTDRNALTEALLKQDDIPEVQEWLRSFWPKDAELASKFLSEWQNAIAQSGLWQGSTTVLQQKLHDIFWLSLLDHTLITKHLTQNNLHAVLSNVVQSSCQQLHIEMIPLLEQLISTGQTPLWQTTIQPLAETIAEPPTATIPDIITDQTGQPTDKANINTNREPDSMAGLLSQDRQQHYLSHPSLPALLEYLLLHGRPPLWLQMPKTPDIQQMVNDLAQSKPQLLRQILKRIQHQPDAMFRLHHLMTYQSLQAAVAKTNPELKPLLTMLDTFHQGLLRLRFPAIDPALLAALLWRKTLQAWLNGDWHNLTAQGIFAELKAEIVRRHPIALAFIEKEFQRNEDYFPKECGLTITQSSGQTHAQTQAEQIATSQKQARSNLNRKNKPTNPSQQTNSQTMPIPISNAGIVLFQGFISTYFNRLGLVKDNVFCSAQAQRNAVHHLQYLATGLAATEEQHLVLNKVLCGLLPSDPIELGIELTNEDKQIGDSLIEAIIKHWSAIGSSSIDGFRGNWLVRDGLLGQGEDRWDLVIEKRPYDLLLQRTPFSYNIIKLPWMPKTLYVTWPT